MRVLLDTHAFLWAITDNTRLTKKARKCFLNEENKLFLSLASVWEIAIKASLDRLEFTKPIDELLPDQIRSNDISLLHIEMGHVLRVAKLPFHHRDPFDRLLVAQSLVENMPLLSADNHLDFYDINRIW